jgi:catechol 2,3-dioxygenase-like lactoylglutathione lyase family enzyme
MIRGIHGLLYSTDAAATRAFFRDTVGLPGSDVGGGWWIFDFAEGDLGIHPVDDPDEAGLHDVSIYCDDINDTVDELRSRGVVFTSPIDDRGYGLVTYFEAPGGVIVQLYEPRYLKPPAASARRKPGRAMRGSKRGGAKKARRKQAKRPARKAKGRRR